MSERETPHIISVRQGITKPAGSKPVRVTLETLNFWGDGNTVEEAVNDLMNTVRLTLEFMDTYGAPIHSHTPEDRASIIEHIRRAVLVDWATRAPLEQQP